jgi:hypothetical protein
MELQGFTGTGSIGYDTDDELNIELSLSTPDDEGLDCFWNEPMLITDPVPKAIWTNDDWADNQGFWSAEEDSLVLGSPTLKKDVDLLTTTWNTATDSATDLYGSMEHPSLTSYSPSHISADLDQICTAVDWSRYNSHQNANQTVPWDDHHMTHDGSRKRQYEPDCSQELSLMSVLNDNTEYLQDTSGGFTSMCYDILDSDESNSDYETLSNPARTDMETFHHAVLEPKPRDEFETRIDAVGTLDGLISIDKDTNGERFVVSIEDFEIEGEEGLLDFEDELEDVELLCMYPIPLP